MKKIILLLPVLLLSACETSFQSPKDPIEAGSYDDTSPHSERFIKIFESSHCGSIGCPAGGSTQTLERDAYVLNNNRDTRMANWVAYRITKESMQTGRPRNWRKDPELPAADTLSPDAYKKAYEILKVDRGHQAPLASMGGTSDWGALNYLSNITPQKSILNRGVWAKLESSERTLAKREDIQAVYVVTGPFFEGVTETLPGDPTVKIPSGYWKVIYIGSSPESGEYAAFAMDQDTPNNADFCDYQVTIDSIERKTLPKLVIWPNLMRKFLSSTIKNKKGTLAIAMCNNLKAKTVGSTLQAVIDWN